MLAALRARRSSGGEADRLRAERRRRRWRAAAGAATLLLLSTAFWLVAEPVERGEFDPVTLAARRRGELELLGGRLGRVPLGPWMDDALGPMLLPTLIDAGHIAPLPGREPRWLEMWTVAGDGRKVNAERSGLYFHLYESPEIETWARQNPRRARLWWRRGFALLRSNDPAERRAGAWLLGDVWPDLKTADPTAPGGWRSTPAEEYEAGIKRLLRSEGHPAR